MTRPDPSKTERGFARRDRYVVGLANLVLRLASRSYRRTLRDMVITGMDISSALARAGVDSADKAGPRRANVRAHGHREDDSQ